MEDKKLNTQQENDLTPAQAVNPSEAVTEGIEGTVNAETTPVQPSVNAAEPAEGAAQTSAADGAAEDAPAERKLGEEEVTYKEISPLRLVLRRFFRSRLSIVGIIMIVALFVFSFLGPIIYGHRVVVSSAVTDGMSVEIIQANGANEINFAVSRTAESGDQRFTFTPASALSATSMTFSGDNNVSVYVNGGSDRYVSGGPLDGITEIALVLSDGAAAGDITVQSILSGETELLASDASEDALLWNALSNGTVIPMTSMAWTERWGELGIDRGAFPTDMHDSYTYLVKEDGTPTTNEDEAVAEVQVSEVLVYESSINLHAAPSLEHFLGTDNFGYDVFTRLMYGGRISLMIGFIVVILETLIGIIIGGISGYFGGWIDQIFMRIVDIFNCIPTMPILLIASAVLDSWDLEADQQIYVLMAFITLFSWSGTARIVRGQILMLREQEYFTATEVMGIPVWRRIFKHLIPNVMPQLIVSMTLGLGSVILYESTLSWLGLGVKLPKAALGTMIATSNDPIVLQYYPNMWLPAGLLISVAVLGFNFIGDGLRDAMDPKARK